MISIVSISNSRKQENQIRKSGQIAFSLHLLLITIGLVIFFNSVFNINGILSNGERRAIVKSIFLSLDLCFHL